MAGKAEKAAAKALEKAKVAVAEAKRSAKKADKAARKRAAKLEAKLESIVVPPEPATVKPATKPASATSAAPIDLESMTVVRLRALARERGVPGYSRFTKAQLVAALGR